MILFQMAYNNMTPEVQHRVADLLKNPNNPEEDGYQTNALDNDVPSAATYPDVYKIYARNTHSCDPKNYFHLYGQPIGDPRYTLGKSTPTPNALTQLASQLAILRDPSAPADLKANALRWTTHLYGDIGAQPAHVVEYFSEQFPEGDKSGSAFKLDWGSNSKWYTSFHSLLDAGGAHVSTDGTSENNFKDLDQPLTDAGRAWVQHRAAMLQCEYPLSRYHVQALEQDPQVWCNELAPQAEQMRSEFTAGEKVQPDDPRLAGIEQTMNRNTAIAAYRLANLCNELFGGTHP